MAATVALDDGADFPFSELVEEGVAKDSDFAHEQGVLLAGAQTFFESERSSPSSVVVLEVSSDSWRVEGMPAHLLTSSKTTFSSWVSSAWVASFISHSVLKSVSGLLARMVAAKSVILSFTRLRSISWKGFPLISSKPIWVAILKAIFTVLPLRVIVVILLLFCLLLLIAGV